MADLHPRLKQDCLLIGRFTLCRLLLMRDANYPWFILVPDREDISEIFQLSGEDQVQLLRESSRLSAVLVERFRADKLNIAALGNVVPQLHVHHVVRYRDDPAWPAPVWGHAPARPYTPEGLSDVLGTLRPGLSDNFEYFQGNTPGN
jgi:diadenosine tetraphosphate (Ap4A) HIT family hydrolase